MKYSAVTLSLAGLASHVAAFPAAMTDGLAASGQLQAPDFRPVERRANGISPGFDAEKQYISTSGKYAYVAPGKDDIRGPCPGLNALANHNYLPHNGVATIQQFIDSTNKVFGMGLDLGGFLSIYGAVFNGDLVSWSIGGPPPASLVSPLAGLLGEPQGISGSHNNYECDVSPTRGDLWITGEAYNLKLDLFKRLYKFQADKTNEESNYDMGIMESYRIERFQDSISGNPYFFNGPFSGFQVQPAAFTFMFRFMANKSQEYPEGRLSQEVLKSFFAIEGDYPDFKWIPGGERIPDNWYKRAIGDEYTIPFFETDLLAQAVSNPQFLDIGGNTGKTNTFTGIDVKNLTGGLYNLETLAEGHNALCFSYQLIGQAGPDILQGKFLDLGKPMNLLNKALSQVIDGLGCPELSKISQDQFNQEFQKYPGASKLNQKGQYPNSNSRL